MHHPVLALLLTGGLLLHNPAWSQSTRPSEDQTESALDAGRRAGVEAAYKMRIHSSPLLFVGGFVLGVAIPAVIIQSPLAVPLGAGGAGLLGLGGRAHGITARPTAYSMTAEFEEKPPEYREAFEKAYREMMQIRRRESRHGNALSGLLVGIGTGGVLTYLTFR